MSVARIFMHGGSQAVRLPKEFRFEGTEVHLRRVGDEVVLSPRAPAGAQALIDAIEGFDRDAPIRREQPAPQRRAGIAPGR